MISADIPLYVCFIDFEKAFDSVPCEHIFKRLEERGVDSLSPKHIWAKPVSHRVAVMTQHHPRNLESECGNTRLLEGGIPAFL